MAILVTASHMPNSATNKKSTNQIASEPLSVAGAAFVRLDAVLAAANEVTNGVELTSGLIVGVLVVRAETEAAETKLDEVIEDAAEDKGEADDDVAFDWAEEAAEEEEDEVQLRSVVDPFVLQHGQGNTTEAYKYCSGQ